MTRDEVAKMLCVIRSAYPQTYSKCSAQDITNMVFVWHSVLEDYTYSQGSAGVRIYLSTDTKGFPPSPGQVIDCIHKAMPEERQKMSSLEAWALVRKALRNSLYNAAEEFKKLPEAVQRALGSADNLKEMSQLDIGCLETVEQSHFLRQYEGIAQQMGEEQKIPSKVRENMKKITETQSNLLDVQEVPEEGAE